MASSLKELLSSLGSPPDGFVPGTQGFPRLDYAELRGKLSIPERARQNAAKQMPSSDASEPDSIEDEIRAAVEDFADKARAEYRSELDAYESRIAAARITQAYEMQLVSLGESAVSNLELQSKANETYLFPQKERVRDLWQQLGAFRAKHRLNRPAKLRSGWDLAMRWSVLVLLLIVETVVNGSFFAASNTAGLFGGFTQAAGISVINIGLAIVLARVAIPMVIHRSFALKAVGVVAIVLLVLSIVGINLAAAHMREAFAGFASGDPTLDVVQRLNESPFLLSDIDSWTLFGVGVVFSIIAAWDASGLWDLYFGYHRRSSDYDTAIQRFGDRQLECLENLQESRDESVGLMTEVIRRVEAEQREHQQALTGRVRLHDLFSGYLGHLGETGARLVKEYREINRSERPDSAPPYFEDPWRLPETLTVPMLEEVGAGLIDDSSSSLVSKMDGYIKEIRSGVAESLEAYKKIEDVLSEKGGLDADTTGSGK